MEHSCPECVARGRVCPQPGEKLGLARVAGQAGDTQPPPKFTVTSYLVRSPVENPASLLTRFGLQGMRVGLRLFLNPNTGAWAAGICLRCFPHQVLRIWLSHRDVSRYLLRVTVGAASGPRYSAR